MVDNPPVGDRRLEGMSAATWRAAVSSPHLRSAMTGIFVLDRALDPEALRQRMEGITRRFPALRSRIVESAGQLGRPRLMADPDFDITLHVAHYVMPAPGSWHQVLQHARRYSLTDLDRDRALWRVVQLDGLRGGRSAVILVVHHAIADGQGLVKIIGGLLDADQSSVAAAPTKASEGPRVRRKDQPAETRGSVDSGGSWPAHAVARMPRRAHAIAAKPSRVASGMLRMAGSARRSGMVHLAPLSSFLAGRCTTYTALTLDVGFGSLRAFAKQHGGTINDAFLTGLTAGFRRYHEAMGAPAGRLRINVPVSFRSESSQADDNTQAIARIVLDAGEPDTGARFSAVQQAVAAAIREPVLTHMDLVAEASRLLPIDAIVAMSRGSDLTASNVPGVPVPVRLAGAAVERIYPVVATMGAAANITLLSYAGRWCSIGVTVDEAAVSSPKLLIEFLAQGFAELGVELAGDPFDPLPEGSAVTR